MKKTIISLFIILHSTGGFVLAAEPPSVVVSIKPIHALVSGVMQGVAEPKLLVKGGGSPHNYALRPSEARNLANADLVVWIGPQLESFLEKPLETLGKKAKKLELLKVVEGPLLELREGGAWERDSHEHEVKHHDHGNHEDPDEVNPHIWLSPLLAKQIVSSTAQVLSELDPAHQQRYAENSSRLQERLDALHKELKDRLTPVNTVPYIVFHDAYHYFESTYGLNAVGSITVDAERRPGARRITEIRAKIKALKARCVFSEPQFESRLVQTVIEGTGARTGVLDPLGIELSEGENSYFILLENLADNLVSGVR
jgi:zinc transport system substrate-binding protein